MTDKELNTAFQIFFTAALKIMQSTKEPPPIAIPSMVALLIDELVVGTPKEKRRIQMLVATALMGVKFNFEDTSKEIPHDVQTH